MDPDARNTIVQVPRLETSLDADWRTVTWKEMYAAIRANIFELCYWTGFNPTPQQGKLLAAVQRRDPRIACKSGQGPGKTTCSVIIGWWWTLQDVDVRTLVTAPSMDQARGVWLAEARERLKNAHPHLQKFIDVTRSHVYFGGRENWLCYLRTASRDTAFQGQHNKRLNAIIEEAAGMEDAIVEAVKGTVSNVKSAYTPDAEPGSILMIGNPNRPEGQFYDCFNRNRHKWSRLTFNAEESPIVNQENVRDLAEEFGRNSDVYRVRVLGEFPQMASRGVINPNDLEACINTDVDHAMASGGFKRQFGIDIARQGGDETVAYRRIGNAVFKVGIWVRQPDFEPAHAIRHCFRRQTELRWKNDTVVYCFDAGGMGQGCLHLFHDHDRDVFEFHTQKRALRPKEFNDMLTEAWFQTAKLIHDRKLLVPDDPVLFQQLTDRRYDFVKKGQIVVESKKDYMKRTKKPSPDRADAFVMCVYRTGLDEGQSFRLGEE